MEALRYYDVEGNERKRKDFDFHHPVPKSKLRGNREKTLGKALLLPMFKEFHNQGKDALHSNVPLPPRPTPDLLTVIRHHIHSTDEINPYDRFLDLNEYLHNLAEAADDTSLGRIAGRYALNFELQTPYILEGQVFYE